MRIRIVLLTLLLVVGACTDGGGDQSQGALVFQVAGEQEEIAVYDALVEAFEQSNPGIEVRLVPVADKDQHLARLTTAFAGGDPPDVFLVNFREYSQFVTRGAIEPIDPHIGETGVSVDDYFPQPVEAFTYDGALQCMPQNVSSLVVYYNVDLFREMGVARPEPGWTWEDFRHTALDLTEGNVKGLGIEPDIIRMAPFVWSNGGEIVDDPESPTRFTLETPQASEALAFILSLVRDDEVVPTEEEVAAEDLETRFMTGKVAMLLSSRRETPAFREVAGLNWDVAPLPIADEPVGILHSDGYCISRGSDRLDEAVAFVGYAIGEQGQTITALGGRTVPSLMFVANSGAFLDPTRAPQHSEVFLDAIPNLRRTPVIPTWPEIEDLAAEILTRAFYEPGYSIQQAIDDLRSQTDALFEEGSSG